MHNWKCLKGLEILSERNSCCSELRFIYPTHSKAYLLTLGCGERKSALPAGHEARRMKMLRLSLPEGFQTVVFKANSIGDG